MGVSIPALAVGSTAGLEGGGLGALLSSIFGGGAAAAGAGAAGAGAAGAADAAGLTGFDALSAGLTPLGGATGLGAGAFDAAGAGAAGAAGAGALDAGAGAAAGGGIDLGLGGGLAGNAGFNAIDAAAGIPGVNGFAGAAGAADAAAPAAAVASPSVGALSGGTGGASAAGIAGLGTDTLTGAGNTLNIAGAGGGAAGDALSLAPGAGAASGGGLSSIPGVGGVASFLGNNPGLAATLGVGGAGLLLAPKLSKSLNPVPQQDNLTNVANQEASLSAQQQQLGTTLTNPLVTGQLPPQAEQVVQNSVNDAISTTKARYANLGLSGSTMEADAISNIQNQSSGLTFQIAQQMAATGEQATSTAASALGLQDQVYSQLMSAQVAQDSALQQAIASFAGAAALGQGISAAKTATG